MITSKLRLLAAVGGVMFVCVGQSAMGDVVYNNSTNDVHVRFNPGALEVGDQVILAGTSRVVTNFTFEYYGLNLSGDEQAIVRFYRNDGALNSQGVNVPQTQLWSSGVFPIGNTSRATLSFDLTADNVLVPNTFTWSIQFALGANISGIEAAGVDIFTPPTVGSNFADYWEKAPGSGGAWTVKANGFVDMDFAARISATPIPEPSVVSLVSLAAAGVVLLFRRRKV